VPGAVQGRDGRWYLRKDGRWHLVEP
jgi:hypothetical protein